MPATSAVEEHQSAKVAREAAKVEAARVAAEKVAGEEALAPLTLVAVEAASEYVEADTARNSAQFALGDALLAVEGVLAQFPALNTSIGDWSETNLPEVSGPSFGTSPAYRALQAAKVAQSVRGGVGAATIDAVRPMYRIKDVPGATGKVFAAAKRAAGRNKPVRRKHVEEALESLFPKDESKSPGPAKGSAKPKPRNTPVADDKVTELPDRVVSDARLGSAAVLIGKVFESLTEEGRPAAHSIAAAVIASCEKYGIAATKVAVEGVKPAPVKVAAKGRKTSK